MFEINREPFSQEIRSQKPIFRGQIQDDFISTNFRSGSSGRSHRQMVFFHLVSNAIDFLATVSISLLMIAAFGYFQLLSLSMMPRISSIAIILFTVFKLSQTLTRTIFAQSLGDWACGLKMLVIAKSKSRLQKSLRILLRSLLHLSTGIIVLPLISFLLNEDIAGKISKAYLFKFSAPILK